MVDIVSRETRSRMMSGIRGANTKPEILVRKLLFARGFRYRLHAKHLPGKPDIVLPRWRAMVFVHGCFWHRHDCHLFRLPATRRDFWKEKIGGNVARDARHHTALLGDGWRIATVWECALKGRTRRAPDAVGDELAGWLRADSPELEVRGAGEETEA